MIGNKGNLQDILNVFIRKRYLPVTLLLVLAMFVFLPVCRYGFLFYDDNLNVYRNPYVANFSVNSFLFIWSHPYEGLYIPLTYSVWGLLALLSRIIPPASGILNPQIYHMANLILHGASVAVVYLLFRRLTFDRWIAAAGCAVFAVHPLQVEPVAWVTGMKDVLCGLFSVLSLWQFSMLSSDEDHLENSSGYWIHYSLTVVFFLAAVLAKVSAVTVPVVAFILGYLIQRRLFKRLIIELVPLVVLVLPIIIATKIFQPDTQLEFLPSLWQRMVLAGDALSFYIWKLLLPLQLGPDYGRTPKFILSNSLGYFTGITPYILCGVMIYKGCSRFLVAAVGVSIGFLLPVLGFVSFSFQEMSTVADRYSYLALLGPSLAVCWFCRQYENKITACFLLILVTILSMLSMKQVHIWENPDSFNRHALKVNSDSAMAYHNLGLYHEAQGNFDQAIVYHNKALQIKPGSFKAYNNLGLVYGRIGRFDEAVGAYQKALLLKPDYAIGYHNLAVAYVELGRNEEALQEELKAVGLNPQLAEAYGIVGYIYSQMGRKKEAISYFRKALVINSQISFVKNELAKLGEME